MPFLDQVEMGLTKERLVSIAADQEYYPPLFEAAFGTPEIDADRIARARAQFVRSLVSMGSRYDTGRQLVGRPLQDFPNFTVEENEGKRIFMTNSGGHGRRAHAAIRVKPSSDRRDGEQGWRPREQPTTDSMLNRSRT